jgi:hypothetical protein
MGSTNVGTGGGVKSIGIDTGSGKRAVVSNPAREAGTPGAAGGGVQSAAGGEPTAEYPQGAQNRSGRSAVNVDGRSPIGPGDGGGVKSVPSSSGGRGAPGAAPPPASARRLTGAAPVPRDPSSTATPMPTGQTSSAELANRRGLIGATPDGSLRG